MIEKKVLQVVSCLELGGTEAFIMNNYRQMDRSKIQFDFLVFVEKDYPYTKEIQRMGGRIFFCGTPQLKRVKKFLQIVQQIIKENGPYDAVHSHVNIANGWVLLAAKKAKVPIRISHSHDTAGKGKRKLYRKLEEIIIKKSATHYLACSEVAGAYLYGKKYFKVKGQVLCNGIQLGRFISLEDTLHELKKEFKVSEEACVIGNITRFEPKKNPLFTLEVFSEILKIKPNAVLLLGGPDGGQLDAVKKRAKELNIENAVRFIGPRTDIPQCLQLIDIYLFPSLFEGLGIALLEAQASGCECFASTGVSKEADMGLGTAHFLDLKDSPADWAEKIISCYEKRVCPSKAQIEKAFSVRGYNIEESSKELLKIYEGKQ